MSKPESEWTTDDKLEIWKGPGTTDEDLIPFGPGVAQIVTFDTNGEATVWDEFIYNGVRWNTNEAYLSGIQYLSRSHAAWSAGTHTEKYVCILDLSNDFKHCWVLWSDMRNNGNADADGGERKKDFGLLYPTTENYELSLSFVDQFDDEGNIDKFLDLKILLV